ncbi:MAG TPA: divalent-cation tolerance protein CutA [Rhizobiales bacterium]|nr:divalent-cation tolerance protein CutA [bacterium BMS3Bbin10]HDO52838.1 divalent-cation tolerance protein CutA [Hyphomicrobiales bacterium]
MTGQENKLLLIYTTLESVEDAKSVGRALVESKLAACVNILPAMTAIYEWQGELQEAGEVVMLIKTRKGCLDEALARAKEMHPYDTPALLVIEPSEVDRDFAAWIVEQTSAP